MKRSKRKSIVAPAVFSILGAIMIIYGVFNSFLSVAGAETVAVVDSSTYFHKNSSAPNIYSYDVSYTFSVDGNKYTGSGYVTKQMYGGPAGSISVKYFPAAPGLNEPAKGIGNNMTGMMIGGALLMTLNIAIVLQDRKSNKNTKGI